MQKLTINGYSRFNIESGIHSFMKQDGQSYSVIECTTEQLNNGDIQFMTEHGLTLNASRKRAEKKKYNNRLTVKTY